MKTATVSQLKQELKNRSKEELLDTCLALTKFKKENKEYLTYLLLESENETAYVESVNALITEAFESVNVSTIYFTKKTVRKALRLAKKHIRFSKQKYSEIAILIHFCKNLRALKTSLKSSVQLQNIYLKQFEIIEKSMGSLHEDLQFDFQEELEELQVISFKKY